ncbi:MAG: hypothetical protein HEEMFOPI_00301 [Holosporales bacterium]
MIPNLNLKKTFKFLFIIVFLVLYFVKCTKEHNEIRSFFKPNLNTVCIMQIAPHPSLDKIRKGIEDVINQSVYEKHTLIKFQNAQGNPALSQQIAQQFIHLKPTVIVPITTLCALNAYQSAKDKNIPVVFSGVTDPKSAKLSCDGIKPHVGITGISDFMPPQKQVDFLNKLFEGKGYKKIGTIYNAGEQNTVVQIEEFEKELNNTDLILTKIGVHQAQDIGPAILKIAESVDFILIFNDNFVVSSMPQILKVAKEKKIPVISTDPESVEMGALASLAYDQYEMGRQTGLLVLKILDGQNVHAIDIENAKALSIYFNETVAKEFNVDKPKQNNGIKIVTK